MPKYLITKANSYGKRRFASTVTQGGQVNIVWTEAPSLADRFETFEKCREFVAGNRLLDEHNGIAIVPEAWVEGGL